MLSINEKAVYKIKYKQSQLEMMTGFQHFGYFYLEQIITYPPMICLKFKSFTYSLKFDTLPLVVISVRVL